MKKNILLVTFLLAIGIIGGISLMAEPNCQDCEIWNPGFMDWEYQSTVNGSCYDENRLCFFTTECNSGNSPCPSYSECNENFCSFVTINP